MQEKEYKCEGCSDVETDILALNNRVQVLEHSHARMKEAFPQNDLKLPGYDEHRTEHKRAKEQEEVIQGYKRDTTKTILAAAALFIAGIFSTGFFGWLKIKLGG